MSKPAMSKKINAPTVFRQVHHSAKSLDYGNRVQCYLDDCILLGLCKTGAFQLFSDSAFKRRFRLAGQIVQRHIQNIGNIIKKLITRPSNTIFNVSQRINSDSELFSELFAGQSSELPCCSDSIAHHM